MIDLFFKTVVPIFIVYLISLIIYIPYRIIKYWPRTEFKDLKEDVIDAFVGFFKTIFGVIIGTLFFWLIIYLLRFMYINGAD